MDDIVSATPPTFTEQKKRSSDESERSLSNVPTAFTKINTSLKKMNNNNLTIETSNNSHKNNSTTTSSSQHHITSPTHISVQTSATEQPKRLGHKRTASTQPGLTMHINNNHNKSTKLQGRRGSLPPLLKIPTQQQSNNSNTNSNNNKLNNVDFSPVSRSPFTSNLPPLPEKGSISINIHHPTKNDLGKHLIQPQHENMIKNISYILLWYFFSTSLSLYNKNLMGRDRFNFQFPLLVSAVHSAIHAVIAFLMLSFGGDRWQSKPSSINQESNQASLSTFNYIYKVVPCGIAAALEICCANASLVFITLSFYTMVKSSTPVWVLLFSFLFGFEKPKLALIAIITVIVTGVFLTIEGETKFDMIGFILVLVAAIVSGLRWNLTQLLLQQDRIGINSPITTLYYLSPVMFITMAILSLIFENPIDQFRQSEHFDNIFHILESFGLMAIGGLLAFAMTLAELYLIKNTNTVTLSVAGISKEIVVITLSVIVYGDELTPKNILGLIVSICGIIGYNYYKLSKSRQNDKGQYQMIPMTMSRKLED